MTLWPPSRLARRIGRGAFTVVALAVLAPFIAADRGFGWWQAKTAPANGDGWQRWYAWLPTFLYHSTGDEVVWLQPVERYRWRDMLWYRRIGDTKTRFPWDYGESPEEG